MSYKQKNFCIIDGKCIYVTLPSTVRVQLEINMLLLVVVKGTIRNVQYVYGTKKSSFIS